MPYRGGICTRIIAICQTSAQRMYKCTLCIHTHTHASVCLCVCLHVHPVSYHCRSLCATPLAVYRFVRSCIHTYSECTYIRMYDHVCVRTCMYMHTYMCFMYVRARSFVFVFVFAFVRLPSAPLSRFIVIFTLPLDSLLLLSFLLTLFVDVVDDAYSSCNLSL